MAGLLILAAGCSGEDEDLAPCPQARVLSEPSELTRFQPGPGRDLTDVSFKAAIVRVVGECGYDADGGEIDIELTVILDVLRGPANRDGKAAFSYFVALSEYTADSGSTPDILSREAFAVAVEFAETRKGLRYTDVLEITVPRPDDRNVRNYVLFLGIELTAEEYSARRGGR